MNKGKSTGKSIAAETIPLPRTIQSFAVEGLFGMFDYEVAVPVTTGKRAPNILILYGDNGSGKTTLLHMIYRLLDKQDNRGHRTFLAKTPFRRFSVRLSDGTEIEARRPPESLLGEYHLRISSNGKVLTETDALVDEELAITSPRQLGEKHRRQWETFIEQLTELDISFFFLGDDRKSRDSSVTERDRLVEDYQARRWLKVRHTVEDVPREVDKLESAIDRFESWARHEMIKATNVGEAGTANIYFEIANRIAGARGKEKTKAPTFEQFSRTLQALEERAIPFAEFGMVPKTRLMDIRKILDDARPEEQATIITATEPYVDGLRARLDALDPLQSLLSRFVVMLNSFYANKDISYEVARGLKVTTTTGAQLDPSRLSSGERQLLLLLTNVVTAREEATVFLIDEPEISLNVKWQRELVETLSELVRGASVQFILATHSLEILASHREFVHRLGSSRVD